MCVCVLTRTAQIAITISRVVILYCDLDTHPGKFRQTFLREKLILLKIFPKMPAKGQSHLLTVC